MLPVLHLVTRTADDRRRFGRVLLRRVDVVQRQRRLEDRVHGRIALTQRAHYAVPNEEGAQRVKSIKIKFNKLNLDYY